MVGKGFYEKGYDSSKELQEVREHAMLIQGKNSGRISDKCKGPERTDCSNNEGCLPPGLL